MTKKTNANQTIKPELLEHIVPMVEIIEQLPEAVYKGVRGLTISDIRSFARKNEEELLKAKRRGREKGQTQATAELDDQVLKAVTKLGKKHEDHAVTMSVLVDELVEFSDQQIRRSLVRLADRKVIKADGNTRNKTYRAV